MPMFGGPHRLLGRLGGMKSAVVSPRMDDTARRAIPRRILLTKVGRTVIMKSGNKVTFGVL